MKKNVLVLGLLMSLSSFAHAAEWVKVFENIRGTFFYMDPNTIEHHGRLRRVWEMQSYRNASPEGMLSMKLHKEYDCMEEKGRFLNYVAYTGPKLSGEMMGTVNTPSDWQSVNRNPAGKGVFRIVCEDYKK